MFASHQGEIFIPTNYKIQSYLNKITRLHLYDYKVSFFNKNMNLCIIFMSSRFNLSEIMIQDANFIAKKFYSLRKLKLLIIIMPSRFQLYDLKLF